MTVKSFAVAAVSQLAMRLADDMDAHAALIETQGIEISGPEALRTFAAMVRKTNNNVNAGHD